jgi:hypothetical protein
MELYQMAVIAIATANLAVTVWLLRLLLPIWRELRSIASALDQFDFDKLAKQFLGNETPVAESVKVKTSENKEEGYREISIIRTYKKPLDPREIQENFMRQMAEKLQ